MSTQTPTPIADNAERATIGTMELAVVYIGQRSFRWWVINTDTGEVTSGDDLHCASVGPIPDNAEMLVSLAGFLSYDGEAYSSLMGNGEPDDGYLFGASVAELSYLNSDELDMYGVQEDSE